VAYLAIEVRIEVTSGEKSHRVAVLARHQPLGTT